MKILVVDDEPEMTGILDKYLIQKSYDVICSENPLNALNLIKKENFDVVITDINMPDLSGIELMEQSRTIFPNLDFIIMTAHYNQNKCSEILKLGATDFLEKPFQLDELLLKLFRIEREQKKTQELNLANEKLMLTNEKLKSAFAAGIKGMSYMEDCLDPYTGLHNKRIPLYGEVLLRSMQNNGNPSISTYLKQRNPSFITDFMSSSMLHDIGKLLVPKEILNKPDKLTKEEFLEVKKHTVFGYQFLNGANKDYSQKFNEKNPFIMSGWIALHHHEYWDGTGYPKGIAGEKIPLSARVVAICDTYDTIRSKRSYKPELTHEKAVQEILKAKGTQFDPYITDHFIKNGNKFDEIYEKNKCKLKFSGIN